MERKENKSAQNIPDNVKEHQSLEVSMLNKDNFSDEELESYLSKGEIKAYETM